jgi:nucleoside-diphosphate-sugar epimerase
MKYLITGHTGFIGKSLVERLKDSDELFLVGRDWETNPTIPTEIKNFSPDYIIHCAAEIKNSSKTFNSNVVMTDWLLRVTRDVDYRAFINLGSSSEYGATNKSISEKDLLKPRTLYEATKGASTLLCQGHASEYDKPIATIRPFSVYGIYESESRLVPTLFRNFKNNSPCKLSLGVHDFIYVDDFIDGIFSVLYSEREVIKGDVVHFGNGVQYTNLEVFNIIKRLFGKELEYQKINNIFNTYDTLSWVADISYAKAKYKFNPKYSLETGLREIYEKKYK